MCIKPLQKWKIKYIILHLQMTANFIMRNFLIQLSDLKIYILFYCAFTRFSSHNGLSWKWQNRIECNFCLENVLGVVSRNHFRHYFIQSCNKNVITSVRWCGLLSMCSNKYQQTDLAKQLANANKRYYYYGLVAFLWMCAR